MHRTSDCESDNALIQRIAVADEAALQHLCAAYRARLWHYFWYQLNGHAEMAEEALQDTFLAVWNGAARFRGEAPLSVWIFRIAHHIAVKARRDHGRSAEGHLIFLDNTASDAMLNQAGSVVSPEDTVINQMTMTQALSSLSSKHHDIIVLVYLHGFAISEVAQILGIPRGTVRSRLSYARRALSRELNSISSDEAPDYAQ